MPHDCNGRRTTGNPPFTTTLHQSSLKLVLRTKCVMGNGGDLKIFPISGIRRLLVFTLIRSNGSLIILFRVMYTSNLMRNHATIRIVRSRLARHLLFFNSSTSTTFSTIVGSRVIRRSTIRMDARSARRRNLFVMSRNHKGHRARSQRERNFSRFRIRMLIRSLYRSVRPTKKYVTIRRGARPSTSRRGVTRRIRLLATNRQTRLQRRLFGRPRGRQRRRANMCNLYTGFSTTNGRPSSRGRSIRSRHGSQRKRQRGVKRRSTGTKGTTSKYVTQRRGGRGTHHGSHRHPNRSYHLPRSYTNLSFCVARLYPPGVGFISPVSSSLSVQAEDLPPGHLCSVIGCLRGFQITILDVP